MFDNRSALSNEMGPQVPEEYLYGVVDATRCGLGGNRQERAASRAQLAVAALGKVFTARAAYEKKKVLEKTASAKST